MDGVELKLVDSLDAAFEFKRWAGERRGSMLAVDTETSGLDTNRDMVRLVQFGDSMTGWAMAWERWSGVALEVLQGSDDPLLFHNAKYDVQMLERCGDFKLEWRRVHDTRTLAWLNDPTRATALKSLAAWHVDSRAGALSGALDSKMELAGWTWATVPTDLQEYWAYGALDCVLTSRVWEALAPRVFCDPGLAAAYELELAALPVMMRMEQRGTAVDVRYAEACRESFIRSADEGRAWCLDAHGISPTSTQALSRRLTELGVVLTKLTRGGAFSVDEEVLTSVQIEYGGPAGELATTALMVRKLTKLSSTYLEHLVVDSVDGRFYGGINPLGAPKTGRMSMSGMGEKTMSLQTLPRADDGNPAAIAVRDCFVPSEGMALFMSDFDQIELRLIAHFCQDPTMLEVLADPTVDPFTGFARRIYGDPTLAKKDPRRQLTKNAIYAKGYGAGPAKFSLTAGVPLQQGAEFLATFDQRFPGMLAFQQLVQRLAYERHDREGVAYIRTPYGAKLQCDRDKVYKLVNYLVQGTAAQVMKRKLIELDMAGLGQYLLLPVHDEVVCEAPIEDVAAVSAEVGRVMTEERTFTVPLPAGVDGPFQRWGEKYR